MKRVERAEILDYVTYEERRDSIRKAALAAKEPRRIHLGDDITILFENRDTVRYQVQEMVRVERLVKESEIQHELDTYNELLGDEGQLGCTLLIEIDDKEVRDVKLKQWLDLPENIYLRLEDGKKVYATFDPRQKGEDRLSSVQFLKLDTKGCVPVAAGVDVEGVRAETELSEFQRQALAEDLGRAAARGHT
ncbi:MAG: hypothetical protein A2341_20040 [Deltaproteobacteria bacterium RIFOXYB12_FULL_58_9]|nr:MAG: hypothetical protein A2341_20040 [Deltaproteobacteria bacterium RIFOXYB12_FULL_58_9]